MADLTGRAQTWFESGDWFEWLPSEPGDRTEPLRIFHAERGDPEAPVLLLVHGFPTSSIDWFEVVEPLSERNRVCLVDFPGYGFSDKPTDYPYSLGRDAELLGYYLQEIVKSDRGAVVAHDRGDSVSLAFLERCTAGDSPFEITDLVLSNANIYLPLSNLTDFQRMALDPATAPAVLASVTPEALALGMGLMTFTPRRGSDDPAVSALAETFAFNNGVAVLHDTIQYLVERSERETEWLELLAASSIPTTLIWGLHDTVSPPRVAHHVWLNHLARKPGDNTYWTLPRANHYLQEDQPEAFVAVVDTMLHGEAPPAPGPISDEPGAPLLVDRSRAEPRTAKDALQGT